MSPQDAYALTIVCLFFKMFAISLVQAYYRVTHKHFVKPEDAQHWGDGQIADAEHPMVERAQRVLRNDLENIPILLFLLGAYVMLDAWAMGVSIYGGVFVLSRVVHTLAYLRPTQPLRNRAYLTGLLVCMALSGHIVHAIWTSP